MQVGHTEHDGRDFGWALEQMKAGATVARKGWNGKDMWIAYSPGNDALPWDKFWSPAAKAWARKQFAQMARVLPCFIMKTADNAIQMGWLASQSDMNAHDWFVVEQATE